MWIFTRYGFFSVASARGADGSPEADLLAVRARRISHLRLLLDRLPSLGRHEILSTHEGDWRYRIFVARTAWGEALGELAREQRWASLAAEASRFQGKAGGDYLRALQDVAGAMRRLQESETRFRLVNRDASGVITNAGDLSAEDVVHEKVRCPACEAKDFALWPEGWDGHAGYACTVEGETPEERKANFKRLYRHLFR